MALWKEPGHTQLLRRKTHALDIKTKPTAKRPTYRKKNSSGCSEAEQHTGDLETQQAMKSA
jgi:hypothetical protein